MATHASILAWRIPRTEDPGGLQSTVTQMVKNLPAMQETWFLFLDQEHLLEKEMATYSSILAWRFPWTEEPGGLQSMRLQELDCILFFIKQCQYMTRDKEAF